MARRIRKLTLEQAEATPKRTGKYTIPCSKCPKFAKEWCGIFAKRVLRDTAACKYGKILIGAIRQDRKWRKKK